jgi:hypothetical protein
VLFFSPRTGFLCDEVERFEVILHLDHSDILAIPIIVPDCPSIRPNHVSYYGFFPDLWLALKSGSDNFGIVTAFDIILIEQSHFWGSAVGFRIDTVAAQFSAFEALSGQPKYDLSAALIQNFG